MIFVCTILINSMQLLIYLSINLIFNSIIVIVINELLLVDGIVAMIFAIHSSYNNLYESQKKQVLITFSKTVTFVLLLLIPLIQIVLTLFSFGVVIVWKVYWLYSIMLSYDFIEIYLRNKNIQIQSLLSEKDQMVIKPKYVLIKQNARLFLLHLKDTLRTKEFIINTIITIIVSFLDISKLNVVHCITIFYITELFVFYEKVLIATEMTFGSVLQLNARNVGYLKRFNDLIWGLNYVLQGSLILKIIIRGEANFLTYLYIYSIPIIIYNS